MTNEKCWLYSISVALPLILTLFAGQVSADGPYHAGLVARFGDGDTFTQCVEFFEAHISGLEVLQRSGLEVIYEQSGPGATVCKIEGDGCDYPSQPCFCQCPGGPSCAYWSYWHLKDGTWEYSMGGASGYRVYDGAVEGWTWGPGTTEGGPQPPVLAFESICAPPATSTPTHTPTYTPSPSPTSTDTPSPTPLPTHTPFPTPVPTHTPFPTNTRVPPTPGVTFAASPDTIALGGCAELHWDIEQAQAVYFDGWGVVGHQVQQVCPEQTQSYELLVVNEAGEFRHHVTVSVVQPSPTPIPTQALTSIPTRTSTPTAIALGTDTPAPPTQSPASTAAGLPSATSGPTAIPRTEPSITPMSVHAPTSTPTLTPLPKAMPSSPGLAALPPVGPSAEMAETQGTKSGGSSARAIAAPTAWGGLAFVGLLALLGVIYLGWRRNERE